MVGSSLILWNLLFASISNAYQDGSPYVHISIEMVSDLDFSISVFVGLVSIALSYYCIKDKWLVYTLLIAKSLLNMHDIIMIL